MSAVHMGIWLHCDGWSSLSSIASRNVYIWFDSSLVRFSGIYWRFEARLDCVVILVPIGRDTRQWLSKYLVLCTNIRTIRADKNG
jgi:hypothetical protein